MKFSVLSLVFLIIACQPKKEEDAGIISGGNTTDDTPTTNSLQLATGSPSLVFVKSVTPAGPAVNSGNVSPSLPADGVVSIDTSKIIASIPLPATVPDAGDTSVDYSQTSEASSPNSASSALEATRTLSVKVTETATSCTPPATYVCAVDSTDDKKLNISSIDTSSFSATTTYFGITVNGVDLNVPVKTNTLSSVLGDEVYIKTHFSNVKDAVALGDYIYVLGFHVALGQSKYSLQRIHKTTRQAEFLYHTDAHPYHGTLKSIAAFNGKIYFGAKPYLATDFRFLVYDPDSKTLEQISSSTQLLNPERFLVYNNNFYFIANDSGSGKRLYRMNNSGQIFQLTNSCGGGSDIGFKYHPTSRGIYMTLFRPGACGDRVAGVLKTDDTFEGFAVYSPYSDPDYDGLGTVKEINGKVYFTAGQNRILYRDNADGTVTQLTHYDAGYSGAAPTYDFASNANGIYWVGPYARIWKLDPATDSLTKIDVGYNWNLENELIKLGDEVLVAASHSTGWKKYNRILASDNISHYMTTNTAGNDKLFEVGIYKGERYYLGYNNKGWKFWKGTSDGKLYLASDLIPSERDFDSGWVPDQNVYEAFVTENGIVLSTRLGTYIFQ